MFCEVIHCVGCILANTRPNWGDWKMETATYLMYRMQSGIWLHPKAKGRVVEAPQNYSLFVQLSFKYHCYEQLHSSCLCAHMHNLVKVPNGQKFSSLGTYVVHDFD